MKKIEYVSVDKDVLEFLKVIYFGGIKDPMDAACSHAYLDMNRTIRFCKMPEEKRIALRKKVLRLFKTEIPKIDKNCDTQENYDAWHRGICFEICSYYQKEGIDFYIGQAQKWINMTMKYLYMSEEYQFETIFPFLHVPIDNYVLNIASKELEIKKPSVCWSRWKEYEEQYMYYQMELRNKIKDYYPLRWEFKYWMKEARSLE